MASNGLVKISQQGAVMHFQKGVSADGFAFSTSDAFGFKNDLFIALWGPLVQELEIPA